MSHDETRLASRYGRKTTFFITDGFGEPVDLWLGTKRVKAAAMLMLALPGSAYIYQGEELGLPQIDDLPYPIFFRSGGEMRGRDGCRCRCRGGLGPAVRVLPAGHLDLVAATRRLGRGSPPRPSPPTGLDAQSLP